MTDRTLLDLSDGDDVLAALRAVDTASLYFTSLGLGGPQPAARQAQAFATWMARVALAPDVPDDIRSNFDRVRKTFLYGLLERDLFAIADHEAHLVLEGALRHRFVSYYDSKIPITRDGRVEILEAASFNEYFERRGRLRRTRLCTAEGESERLPFSYPDLYNWVRRRQLLSGQRNVGIFASLVNLRNYAAHPEGYTDEMPPSVARLLADVAEIINKLWGHDTDGGRLFPGPVRRGVRCAALSPDGASAVTFESVAGVATETRAADWTFAVFLVAEREELVDFDWETVGLQRFKYQAGFQMTDYPAELVAGPVKRETILQFAGAHDVEEIHDLVPFQDRLFFIRQPGGAERPEFPRSAQDVIDDTTAGDESARWYVVRADFPVDAWVRIRDRSGQEPAQAGATELIAELVGDDAARASAAAALQGQS